MDRFKRGPEEQKRSGVQVIDTEIGNAHVGWINPAYVREVLDGLNGGEDDEVSVWQ
jgi:hypothetical protein